MGVGAVPLTRALATLKALSFLTRDDMRAVLARSLELYQGRNGGNLPKRLVIHKTTAFKQEEVDGAFDALGIWPSKIRRTMPGVSSARGLTEISG